MRPRCSLPWRCESADFTRQQGAGAARAPTTRRLEGGTPRWFAHPPTSTAVTVRMIPTATAEHYRAQQRLAVVTIIAARRAWARMGHNFDASWRAVVPQLLVLVSAAQLAAARDGAAYLPRVLAETGQRDDPSGQINARVFVGVAADGRSLDGLLYGAVTNAKDAVGGGMSPPAALEQGGAWLDMAIQTAVADAARQSVGVGIAARPHVGGYVRMLNTPSCSRCAILAGKFFKWNAGFSRHPRCDCRHIPASEDFAGDFRTDAAKAARDGHITDLTSAERKAIADGGDLSQVVNSRRGRSGLSTTEGTTRRGLAGQRLGGASRLSPEGIYTLAADDRGEALRLLRAHGYLI